MLPQAPVAVALQDASIQRVDDDGADPGLEVSASGRADLDGTRGEVGPLLLIAEPELQEVGHGLHAVAGAGRVDAVGDEAGERLVDFQLGEPPGLHGVLGAVPRSPDAPVPLAVLRAADDACAEVPEADGLRAAGGAGHQRISARRRVGRGFEVEAGGGALERRASRMSPTITTSGRPGRERTSPASRSQRMFSASRPGSISAACVGESTAAAPRARRGSGRWGARGEQPVPARRRPRRRRASPRRGPRGGARPAPAGERGGSGDRTRRAPARSRPRRCRGLRRRGRGRGAEGGSAMPTGCCSRGFRPWAVGGRRSGGPPASGASRRRLWAGRG